MYILAKLDCCIFGLSSRLLIYIRGRQMTVVTFITANLDKMKQIKCNDLQ
jgi:hypothetical protein